MLVETRDWLNRYPLHTLNNLSGKNSQLLLLVPRCRTGLLKHSGNALPPKKEAVEAPQRDFDGFSRLLALSRNHSRVPLSI